MFVWILFFSLVNLVFSNSLQQLSLIVWFHSGMLRTANARLKCVYFPIVKVHDLVH